MIKLGDRISIINISIIDFLKKRTINETKIFKHTYALKEYLLYTYYVTLDIGENVLYKNIKSLN